MLTHLDTSRLVPRPTPETHEHDPQQNPDQQQFTGPVFTLSDLLDLLENRPELREALHQSLINYKRKDPKIDAGPNG